ncbi:MAG: hypothetical protein Kow0069_03290 [Promethearchaeota archaeon]
MSPPSEGAKDHESELEERIAQMKPAGTLARVVAYVVDAIVVSVVVNVLVMSLPYFEPVRLTSLFEYLRQPGGLDYAEAWREWQASIPRSVSIARAATEFGVGFLYFAGLEALLKGQTAGKALLSIETRRVTRKFKAKKPKAKALVANNLVKANFLLLLLDLVVGIATKPKGDRLNQIRYVPRKTKTAVLKCK